MINSFRFYGFLIALLMSASVYAGDFQVENAWARASAPGQNEGSVDLTIISHQAASLVGASSPACKKVELHSMMMTSADGMMNMREVPSIELPANESLNLRQNGYHLMLTGLKAPLKAGDKFPLTLSIKSATGTVKIVTSVEVKPLNTTR